ncbi:glycosyltransferase [Ferrimonas pelagia]|uniref:Glycosyltransferase n=1 Tax=Ferrimonas pelagia TaxID=1177826 RepID=A0ABP9ECL8_9GAMM
MQNVAYVIPSFPVISETFITAEIRALAAEGIAVRPICFERRDGACQPGDEIIAAQMGCTRDIGLWRVLGLVLFLLPWRWSQVRSAWQWATQQGGIRPRSLMLHGLRLAVWVRAGRCRHIHAHFVHSSAAMALIAGRLLGLPVSFTGHGTDVYRAPVDLPLKLRGCDFAVAVSEAMQADMLALAPAARVHCIPCGIDTELFCGGAGEAGSGLRLLFLGRLSETKGVADLLDALALLPPAQRPRLDLAGDGPLAAALRQQCARLELAPWCRFLGAVDREWLRQHAPGYLAMVLPFCRTEDGRMDTGPLVLKEAMALRLPVITTELMRSLGIVDEETALLCPPSSPKALAQRMAMMLQSVTEPALQRRLQAQTDLAESRVKARYDVRQQAQALAALFLQAMAAQRRVKKTARSAPLG